MFTMELTIGTHSKRREWTHFTGQYAEHNILFFRSRSEAKNMLHINAEDFFCSN